MQVYEALEDLFTPAFDDLQARVFDFLDILAEVASADHLCYEDDLLLLFVKPCRNEVNDVLVFKLFHQVDFWLDSFVVLLWQPIQVDHIPGNLRASFVVDTRVYYLVRASAQLRVEPLEPP